MDRFEWNSLAGARTNWTERWHLRGSGRWEHRRRRRCDNRNRRIAGRRAEQNESRTAGLRRPWLWWLIYVLSFNATGEARRTTSAAPRAMPTSFPRVVSTTAVPAPP